MDSLKVPSMLSWEYGGGVVLPVELRADGVLLPVDAVWLAHFHITLIGRRAFLGAEEKMARAWASIKARLPVPPQAETGAEVFMAEDGGRKTWFLVVANQDEIRSHVKDLEDLIDATFRQLDGNGFTNPESDRVFHVSLANNRGGDPRESIGSVWLHSVLQDRRT